MDVADRAQADIELLARARLSKERPADAQETGNCLYCGEPTRPGERWCSKECRDDWEY